MTPKSIQVLPIYIFLISKYPCKK